MNNQEKIYVINSRITNLNFHIDILTTDISTNPNVDFGGKPTRQDILNDLISSKEALNTALGLLA